MMAEISSIAAANHQTVRLVRAHTNVPVPRILDWSDDSSNPIGAEYIIMPHATGVNLKDRWSTMTGAQQVEFIPALMKMMKEVAAIDFPDYGSLYFSDAPLDPALKMKFTDGYCLGPHCGAKYYNCRTDEGYTYENKHFHRGPCK